MLVIYNGIVKVFARLFETVNEQPDEQSDTTDMPELESEESTEPKKKKNAKMTRIKNYLLKDYLHQVRCLADYQFLQHN